MTDSRGPGRPISPKELRARRRVDWSRAFDAAIREAWADAGQVALILGVSRKTVYRWRDDGHKDSIPLADIAGLPLILRETLLNKLADDIGARIVSLPDHVDHDDDAAAAMEVMKEATAVAQIVGSADRRGHLTADDGEQLEDTCDAMIAKLVALRERARVAKRERVVATLRAVADPK